MSNSEENPTPKKEEPTRAVVMFESTAVPMNQRRVAFSEWLASGPITTQLNNSIGIDDPSLVRRLSACVSKIVSNDPVKFLACKRESWIKALSDSVSTGIIPDGRNAYLIPYGQELQYQLDYKGLVNLYYEHKCVKKIVSNVFCENDELSDTLQGLFHSINWKTPRGKILGAYSIAILNTGEEVHDVMTKDEIEAIRKRSKNPNASPWKQDWNEMAKKTVFRRLSKWIPTTPQITAAIEIDDRNGFDFKSNNNSVITIEQHAKLQSDLASLKNALAAKTNTEVIAE